MKRAAAVLAVALALGGCGGKREAQLRSIADRLAAERDRKAALAQNLMAMRRESKALAAEIASAQESGADPAVFTAGVKDAANGLDTRWDGDVRVTISGTHGAAEALDTLERASARIPAAGISGVTLAAKGSWSATLFRITLDAESAPPAAASTPAPDSVPPPGAFESASEKKLRREIVSLQHQNEMLGEIVGEVDAIRRKRAILEGQVHSLERSDRLVNAEPTINLLLSGKPAPLATGALTFERDHATVKGTLSPAAPIDLLVEVLEKHFALTRKELAPPGIDLDLARLVTD